MDCYRPLRIRNQYNGKWMHVNCRGCEACLIKQANTRASELSTTLKQYEYKYFITLTYTSDYVPYIIDGMDGFIFRGQYENTEQIDYFEELLDWSLCYKHLKNHCYSNAIGVLYFYDLQCFLKRFRKYLFKHYGKREWKYFAIGEYGTKFARPHFHIVVMSNQVLYDECQNACLESWKMHDWSRFLKTDKDGCVVNEGCKPCNEMCAQYISSYVNSVGNNLPISLYRTFRQKTVRSKNIAFGLDAQILETYKRDVVRLSSGLAYEGSRRVFYYERCNANDKSVSLELLPSRYIRTFFHKFKGWSEMDYVSKLSCAANIVGICQKAERLGISLSNIDFVHSRYNMKSDDLSFYRAYKRFKNWYDDKLCIFDYLNLMIKVIDAYKSNLIREQMLEYPVIGKDNYMLSLIDTKVEKIERKLFYLMSKGVKKELLDWKFVSCPPVVRNRLDNYVHDYRVKLLPKHFNDVNNVLYN